MPATIRGNVDRKSNEMAAEWLATKMQLKQRIPMRPMSLVKAQNKPVVLSIALYRLLVKDERLRPFLFFDIFLVKQENQTWQVY